MKKIIKFFPILIFISFLLFFLFELKLDIQWKISERNYYANLLETYKIEKFNSKNIQIVDYGWIPFFIKNENDISFQKINFDEQKVIDSSYFENIPSNIDFSNAKITFWNQVINAPLVIPKDNNTIYKDLEQWVRVSPNAKLPNQKWITFMEWHSWNNYIGSNNFSFFDNLALYYDEIEYKTPIKIETDDFIFEYELFKKEIIKPWEKDFYDSKFYHLILMTCYPRNSISKRAIFHAKLVNFINKK